MPKDAQELPGVGPHAICDETGKPVLKCDHGYCPQCCRFCSAAVVEALVADLRTNGPEETEE